MEEINKYQSLVEMIRTTEDLQQFEIETDILIQSMYHINAGLFEKVLKESVRYTIAREIRKLLNNNPTPSKEEVKGILTEILGILQKLPVLQFILAYEPTEMNIISFSRMARDQIDNGVLLSISYDRSLIGGAVIIYKGKYFDLSLRQKLKEMFEERRVEI